MKIKQIIFLCAFCVYIAAGCAAQNSTHSPAKGEFLNKADTFTADLIPSKNIANITSIQNTHEAQILNLCEQLDSLFKMNGLASTEQIKNIQTLAKAIRSEAVAMADDDNASTESAFVIADCFKRTITAAFMSLDSLPESIFFENKLAVSEVLADLFNARMQTTRILEGNPPPFSVAEILENPLLVERIALAKPTGFSLGDLAEVFVKHSEHPNLEQTLLGLLPFALPELPTPAVFEALPETVQPVFIKFVVMNITKNAFVYSKRMRHIAIANIEKALKRIEDLQKKCRQTEICGDQSVALTLRQQLQELKTTPSGLPATLASVRKSLSDAKIRDADSHLDAAIVEAKRSYASEILIGDLALREGDVWTQVSEGGYGDFFAQLSQTGTFATHSGAVVLEWEDGFPLWFTVEIASGVHYQPIAQVLSTHRTFWRPTFDIETGFTSQAISNLDALGEVTFDTQLSPDIFGKRGKPSLYCAEMVHFLFKNRFNPKGATHLSPYDGLRTNLLHLNAIAQNNALKLKLPPEREYYSPESLHYSPHLRFIGFHQDPSTFDHTLEFLYNMSRRINELITKLTRSRSLAPVPFGFKRKVDAALVAGHLEDLVLPLLHPNKAQELRKLIEQTKILPDGKEKYAVARLSFTYMQALSISTFPSDSNGQVPPNWKELAEQRFKDQVIPLLESLFEHPL